MFAKIWSVLDGWKTRIVSFVVVVYGFLEYLDPMLLSTALGLDGKGRAMLMVGIGIAMFWLRQVTTKPAPPLMGPK